MDEEKARKEQELSSQPVTGEVLAEPPREGTLAWLELQEHEDVLGLELPVVHRVPEGAELAEPDGSHCRVVRPGAGRCLARPLRRYGVCLVHAGGGGWRDPDEARAMGKRGQARRAVLRQHRLTLGISARRMGDPRQQARLRALDRAEQLAVALVDDPLDDPELGTMARQAAVIRALDATYPLATATLELELPADELEVQGMGWQQMQALAARVLGTSG